MRFFPVFILLLLPVALASVPQPPMLVWGDINAACDIKSLSPGILVNAEYNGNVVSSVSVVKEGNLFRFGGPRASDPKLVISSGYPEVNMALYYSDIVGPFVLGTLPNDGNVHYVSYVVSDANCASLYPPAKYSVSVSLPDDCNGTVQGMVFRLYHGDDEVYSITLSGTKSTSFSFDLNGLKYNIPEGSDLVARIYLNSKYTSWTTHYYYGKQNSWSISLPCDTYFPSTPQTEETSDAVSTESSGVAESSTQSTAPQTVTATDTSSTTPPPKSVPKTTSTSTSPPSYAEESNVNVPVTPETHRERGIFGVPLDQAVVFAIVVIMAIIVVVRFFI